MPSYEYDSLKDMFAQFVADNAQIGSRVVTKFIKTNRPKMSKFPSEMTIYNWYYMLTGRNKTGAKVKVNTHARTR